MKKFSRKIVLFYLLLFMLVFSVGCSNLDSKAEDKITKTESVQTKENIEIMDQADHKVSLQVPVDRIVCLQHHSLDILGQLGAQEKVVAVEAKWQKNLGDYIKQVYPNIEALPTPGELKTMNVEAVAELKPDVVIVASQANPEDLKKLDELGIPYITVSLRGEGKQEEAQNPRLANSDKAYTDGLEWAVKTLGKITGTSERADKIWDFCMESRAYVEKQIGDIAEENRVKVFVANEGEQTYGNDKYVGAQLLRAGAINVADKDIQGYKPYNFEQVAVWDPDYIVVQDRYPEVYKEVTTGEKWQSIRAVKEGNVLLAPFWTKPWGNPDTDSVALGEAWLASKFYPEKVTTDYVRERAEKFYKEFYGIEFKGEI